MNRRIVEVVLVAALMSGGPGCAPPLRTSPRPTSGADLFAQASGAVYEVATDCTWDPQTLTAGESGHGSGVGLRSDGWILTNSHVVRDAKTVHVTGPDGVARQADRWFFYKLMDVAVVHVPDLTVTVPRMGDSDAVRIGETVYAVGYPEIYGKSMTSGIVSGVHRIVLGNDQKKWVLQDYIQTDAQANPGNSGGGLFNDRGELIGLVSASLSVLERKIPGICFAIHLEAALTVADQLIATGEFRRGFLDLYLTNVSGISSEARARFDLDGPEGVVVVGIESHEKAPAPPLEIGDLILRVAGKPIVSWNQCFVEMNLHPPGQPVRLSIRRRGRPLEIDCVNGEE